MDLINLIGIVIALALAITLALILWGYMVRRRMQDLASQPKSLSSVAKAKLEEDEWIASLTSEHIEEDVKERLKQFPELAGVRLDFGSASDGSLQIRIDESTYTSVDDIPDARIRKAIEQAVEEFNR